MKRRTIILSSISIFVLIGAGLFLSPDIFNSQDKSPSSETGSAGSENFRNRSPGTGDGDMLEYRPRRGQTYRYSFKRNIRSGFQSSNLLDLETAGILNIHVLKADGPEITVLATADYNKVRGADVAQVGASDVAGLEEPVLVKFNRRGRVLSILFRREMKALDALYLLKDLTAAWLRVLPDIKEPIKRLSFLERMRKFLPGDGDGKPVTIRGEDTMGIYNALVRFEREKEGQLLISKTRTRYARSFSRILIDGSGTNMLWDLKDGMPLKITAAEKFRESSRNSRRAMSMNGPAINSEHEVEFHYLGRVPSPVFGASLSAFRFRGAIYDENFYRKAAGRKKIRTFQARPWKDIKRMLSGIRPDSDENALHGVFRHLTTAVRTRPHLIPLVARELKDYESDSGPYRMLMGALTYSGAPAAQSALVDLYLGESDASARDQVMDAFVVMESPHTPKARRMLISLFENADSVRARDQAGLALGNTLKNALAADSRHSDLDKIRDLFRREWSEADSPARRSDVLDMIGNSGDPHFMDIIESVMRADLRSLKPAAVYNTRFMDKAKVGDFLVRVIGKDKHLPTRIKAAEALKWHSRRPRFTPNLFACIEQSNWPSALRVRCAAIVDEQPEHEKRLHAVLRGIQTRENPEQNLREYIEATLGSK